MAAPTFATRTLADRVAEEIRVEMARQRLNQVELAARMHVAQPWISRRLGGKTPITLDDLEQIAAGLRVPVGDLLDSAARGRPAVKVTPAQTSRPLRLVS